MKKIASTLLLLCSFSFLNAQTQGIAYTTVGKGVATTFVTDYHCLGINTSALGWGSGYEKYKITTGGFEMNGGLYSDAFNSTKLKNLARTMYQQVKKDSSTAKIDWAAQRDAAAEYATAGLYIDGQYNWGGFAFQGPRFGGIAFNVTESYNYYSKLNSTMTDIIFRGKFSSYFDSLTVVVDMDTSVIANSDTLSEETLNNVVLGKISVPLKLSQMTEGSEIRMVWNRSYNFGYGRKIFGKDSVFVIYGGIGGRLIQSMAMFEMRSDGQNVTLFSSITPAFKINYGDVATMNSSSFLNYSGGIPPSVGMGYGLDFSASAILFNKLKVALSVNNIGSVEYKRNVYTVKDTLVGNISLAGLNPNSDNLTDGIKQLLQAGGILTLVGEEKYKMQNPSTLRIGASFHPFRQLSVGFDFVAPFNKDNPGGIENAVISFGGDIKPVKWLQLSIGFLGGGIYKTNMPMGINFILREGKYEFGIASRDALTFFTTNSNTVSGAMGIARVRF
ncbi:MAG: hypothetical protein K0R65_1541 [Crocinitomicaceae bacterium]|jgi:hypothetical protein|nr:hypothetical protein [Crocinitomicaceae bacterium]